MIDQDQLLPIRMPSWLYDDIEKKVVAMIKTLGIKKFPIDPFEIAKKLGCSCRRLSSAPEHVRAKFREFQMSACNYFNLEKGYYVIYYDDSMPYSNIRFGIMHEIGHITLGHWVGSDLEECEANHFAAYALAPSPVIGKYHCVSAADIGKAFDVSAECAGWCLRRYGNWVNFCGLHKDYEKELVGLIDVV